MGTAEHSVRVVRFEILWGKDSDDIRRRWRDLSDEVRDYCNRWWQRWLAWHVQQGSHRKVREWWTALKDYRRGGGAEKPKCPVDRYTKECRDYVLDGARCNDRGRDEFPGMASRLRELLNQRLQLSLGDASHAGAMNRWVAILCYAESLPSRVRSQPILFDTNGGGKLVVSEDGKSWWLEVVVSREPRDGKPGVQVRDRLPLRTQGRGVASALAILRRIFTGEHEFAGSSLVYDDGKRKWFAMISYRRAKAVRREDLSGVLVVRALRSPSTGWQDVRPGASPLFLYKIDHRRRMPVGWIDHVQSVRDVTERRRALLSGRWSRQHQYRDAGSNAKGHGRTRALRGVVRLNLVWRNYSRTCNQTWARKIAERAVEIGCGTVIFRQPVADYRHQRLLSCAGKVEGRQDSTLWDWHQLKTCLENACDDLGVTLVTQQVGGVRGEVVASGGRKKAVK